MVVFGNPCASYRYEHVFWIVILCHIFASCRRSNVYYSHAVKRTSQDDRFLSSGRLFLEVLNLLLGFRSETTYRSNAKELRSEKLYDQQQALVLVTTDALRNTWCGPVRVRMVLRGHGVITGYWQNYYLSW